MTLRERTRSILQASVRDFIETGLPVTSARLYEKYDFGIKPAMIRWELHDLTVKNFFNQEHPSGGRIPRDQAYQFFAESIIESLEDEEGYGGKKALEMIRLALGRHEKEFIKKFAEELGILGICFNADSGESWQSGFAELIRNIESEKENVFGIVRDFEMIPERLAHETEWWEEEEELPRVFIGKSPVTKSSDLSVVAGRMNSGRLLILAVGPKRMDYERSVKLIKRLMV